MKMVRSLLLGAGVAALGAVVAFGGQWNNSFPIVNGASFCATTINATCRSTIAAGPALTGSETFPADTNVASGGMPQTVQVPIRTVGLGPYVYNAPLTGASITLTATTRRLIVEPAGTIAELTVVTPAASALLDNQLLGLCTTQIVSTLTVTAGTGTTVSNAPTALLVPVATGAGSCVEWVYRASNTTWYRVQ